ncbi:zinc-activated ligand-gated ion channel-like [Engraulis encrasicolus]|uniref:zinc-activated ligand-gated ion channel-like n=1 Tax=Engraulis encrasicolus TaxID=184585 RepID=UPI002FD1065A
MNLHKVLGGIILCVLVSVADLSNTSCVTRRCLAALLIAKEPLSQPQSPTCDLTIDILSLQYTTIYVDTKKMHFSSQLSLVMKWVDPDLSWDRRTYNYGGVVLPKNKIWTPILTVENAVSVSSNPVTNDVLVMSTGVVVYQVVMDTTVKCSINLFYYPFVADSCLVPLNGRTSKSGCGVNLTFPGYVNMTEATSEWITNGVELTGESTRHYLNVSMSVSIFNPTVSLILPCVLLLLADVVSCLLPLGGGERNSFKVTLVLSFTMFLLQLTQTLPDTDDCSPLLRYHYLVSLLLMLQSMLSSMVLTHMVGGCTFLSCLRTCKKGKDDNLLDGTHTQQGGNGRVIGGDQDNTAETIKEDSLGSMAYILKAKRQQEEKEEKYRAFAEKLDLALFLLYICLCVIYGVSIAYVITLDFCVKNKSVTWSDDYDDYD